MSQRLERLLNLTAALLHTRRPLTAAEIAERVPGYPGHDDRASFQRAFERDKAALREMGVPVELVDIPGAEPAEQGYLIRREDYALRDPGLAPDEAAALHLALAAVDVEGLPGTDALWKLGGVPDVETAEAAPPVAAIPALPALVPLFTAAATRATVTFAYRGATRRVDPHRLRFIRGHWYLDGHDHDRQAGRRFRVDRIDGQVTVGAPGAFEPPPPAEDREVRLWEIEGDEPLAARVRIDASHAAVVRRQLDDRAAIAEAPDGSIEVGLVVTNRDGFRSFVLAFLEHAEILEPPELRDDLVEWLTSLTAVV